MTTPETPADPFAAWVDALEARHLSDLTVSEVGRALRALSSCYVERRGRLAEGAALSGAGKRAAFALFYAPLHFLIVRHVLRSLQTPRVAAIEDLGCGTGPAGAAWALESPGARVAGVDRHPWAVAEANWTYARLGIRGQARQGDVTRGMLRPGPRSGLVAAYTINELPDEGRERILQALSGGIERGAAVLIVEPIARRMAPWWDGWADAFTARGGRTDEWRFRASLPPRLRQLARSAGLQPDELTARTLFAPPS